MNKLSFPTGGLSDKKHNYIIIFNLVIIIISLPVVFYVHWCIYRLTAAQVINTCEINRPEQSSFINNRNNNYVASIIVTSIDHVLSIHNIV